MKKVTILLIIAAIMASCGGSKNKSSQSSVAKMDITAAGATFPQPYYNQVFSDYAAKTGHKLTYGGIGSGGGIRSLKDRVVDFGATDAFLTDGQAAELPASVVHLPTCLGAVVIAFNLPGISELKIKNEVLADVFLGKIIKWNDEKIKADNPGITLPDMKISVVYRSDGSGTTHIFSDYMSKISQEWSEKVGTGKALNWPTGMGAKGNPGVAGIIKQTPGTVGYIGSEYAFAQKIPYVLLQNQAGNFVAPTVESVSAAARGEIPVDTRVMVTNSSDPDAYPISGFTWIILYKEQAYNKRSIDQARETLKFLQWLVGMEAQSVARQVDYAPLPDKVVALANEILKSVTYEGKPVL